MFALSTSRAWGLFLLCLPLVSYGQQPRCKIDHYTTEDGLSSDRITSILKDSEGFNAKLREFERLEPGEDVIENEFLNDGDKVFTM